MDDGDAKLDEENISIECTRHEAGNETENHSSKISPLLAELINAEKRSKDEEESRDRTTEQKQEKLHTMQENLKVRDTDSEKYLGNSRTSTACKSSVVRTFQLRDQLEVTNSAAVTSEQMHDEATLCQTEHEGGERDAFAGIGITNETLNILSDSNIHPSERSINEYPQVYEALDDLEKKSEEQKEEGYEENGSQAQMKDEESLINTGSEEANINVFWNRCIQNSLHKTVTKLPFKEAPILNIYHNPMYFKYLREKKLPTVTLWTNLCLGDLSRFNEIYDIRAPTTAARSIRTQNRTSGQIEGFFSVLKRDVSTLKLPLDHFVGRLCSNHKGLRRQYADGLWSGSCDKKKNSKDSSTTKSKKRVGKSENEDDLNTYSNIEETWNKTTPKRKKNTSFGAYRPGQTHVEFEPNGPHHKSKTTPIQEMLAFYAFRDQTWKTEGPTSPTIAHCINSIQRKWRRLSQNEKEEFFDERDAERLMKSPCLCNFTYEQRPDAMVMCDL
eukprot:Seg6690.1 transcript_id=Seg6690.1/GoldUCD/mRNA.D3Y31 product="hypothetical protein" protein_id=Seg6690.1/GoldUCD/D3Y31